jgi:hypothetical protein
MSKRIDDIEILRGFAALCVKGHTETVALNIKKEDEKL